MTHLPTVSIIMPAYNSQSTLSRAVESVLKQEFQHWELLLVNDASTDRTREIAEKFSMEDSRIKLMSNKNNQGAGVSRNFAIKEAKGNYIAFLDADDEWLPEKLNKQVAFMQEKHAAFSCTGYIRLNSNMTTKTVSVPSNASREDLLKNNTVGALTAMYSVDILGKIYMPEIRRRQDYALWLEILSRTDKVYGLDEALAIYHHGHKSLSSNKFAAARDQWRFYRKVLDLNVAQSLYYFSFYAFNGIRRNLSRSHKQGQ